MTDHVNGTRPCGVRTGECPLVEMDELTKQRAQSLGASGRISSAGRYSAILYQEEVKRREANQAQLKEDRGTWYEHHDVPPAYRGFEFDGLGPDVVERILDALDPERTLRRDTQISPELVKMLALPVQYETGILKRADLEYVEPDKIAAIHRALGDAVAEMKAAPKAPRTQEYLWRLRDAYLNGKGGNGKGTAAVDTVAAKKPNLLETDDANRGERLIRTATRFNPELTYAILRGTGVLSNGNGTKNKASGPKGGAGSDVSEPSPTDTKPADPLNVKFRSRLPEMGIMMVFGLEAQPVTAGAQPVLFAGIYPVNGVKFI